MPTLMLRGLPPALLARLTAYAERVGLGRAEAAVRLIESGLRVHERAILAGQARAATRDPDERAASLARARAARWPERK